MQVILALETDKRYERIKEIIGNDIKSNICLSNKVRVMQHSKSKSKITVTLKNTNGCSWNIKSTSKIRVNFTDDSYETVYLSNNITLKSRESYTFKDCYPGSSNESKTVKNVNFIDWL